MPTEDRLLTRGIFQNSRARGKGVDTKNITRHYIGDRIFSQGEILAIAAIAGSMQTNSVPFHVY